MLDSKSAPEKKSLAGIIGGVAIVLYLIMYFGFNLTLSNLRMLGANKDKDELKQYACLFRDKDVGRQRFCEMFSEDKLHKVFQRAANAFNMPYSVLFCTVLIESGFDPTAANRSNGGYGQFSALTVKQLRQLVNKKNSEYLKMWNEYTNKGASSLTDQNVMRSSDLEIPVGAVALYSRWIFDRINKLNCAGCGPSSWLTDKKVALMIAGYNWSPFKVNKIASMSLSDMTSQSDSPMPEISRRYVQSMRYCRDAGEFEHFRQNEVVQDKRTNECSKACG